MSIDEYLCRCKCVEYPPTNWEKFIDYFKASRFSIIQNFSLFFRRKEWLNDDWMTFSFSAGKRSLFVTSNDYRRVFNVFIQLYFFEIELIIALGPNEIKRLDCHRLYIEKTGMLPNDNNCPF